MLLPRFEVLLKVFGCQDQFVVSELRLEATESVFLEAIPLLCQEVVHQIDKSTLSCSIFANKYEFVIFKADVHCFRAVQP